MRRFVQQLPAGVWLVAVAIVVYIIVISAINFWKYYTLQYNALDLAIIHQAFYNTALGNFFASSIHPPSYLTDHFTPFLFLLLPFYVLYRSPETLLFLQTLALGLSALPIYLIARQVLARPWATGMALAWLLNPLVQNANLFEFHFLAFAPFFILWAFYFYQTKRFWAFVVMMSLTLLVREDVSLIVFGFGILSLIEKRKLRWLLAPLGLGLGYFFAAFLVQQALVASSYKFFIYYQWLGTTTSEPLLTALTKPWRLLGAFLTPQNGLFILGLMIPFVFAPLGAMRYLVLGLLVFGQIMLRSGGGSLTVLLTHYASLLLPVLTIAMIYGVRAWQKKLPSRFQTLLSIIVASGVLYANLTLGPLTGVARAISRTPRPPAQELLTHVPTDAAVAASYDFLAPLSSRQHLYSFNYIFLGKQQFLSDDYELPPNTRYILLDFAELLTYELQYGNNPFYRKRYETALPTWQQTLDGFGLVAIKNSVGLFEKNAPPKHTLVNIVTGDDLPEQTPIAIDEMLTLLGLTPTQTGYEIFWEVQALPKLYYLKATFSSGAISYVPFGYGLLTPVHVGKIVKTNHWFSEPVTKLEVVDVVSGGVEVSESRGTKNVIDHELILAQLRLP